MFPSLFNYTPKFKLTIWPQPVFFFFVFSIPVKHHSTQMCVRTWRKEDEISLYTSLRPISLAHSNQSAYLGISAYDISIEFLSFCPFPFISFCPLSFRSIPGLPSTLLYITGDLPLEFCFWNSLTNFYFNLTYEGRARRHGCLYSHSLGSNWLFFIQRTHLEDYDKSQTGGQNRPVLFGKLIWVWGPWRLSVILKPARREMWS